MTHSLQLLVLLLQLCLHLSQSLLEVAMAFLSLRQKDGEKEAKRDG